MGRAVFTFSGMNNVSDPADLPGDSDGKGLVQFSHAVDLVNVDCDNGGGTGRRGRRTDALPSVDTVTVEATVYSAGAETISIGAAAAIGSRYVYGQFRSSLSGGDIVEYYNGRLYRAGIFEGKYSVLCSPPLEYDMVDTRSNIAHLSGNPITMVGAVDDGLYVGTTAEVLFLPGNDPFVGGFGLRQVLDYGAIKGTRVRSTGKKIKVAGMSGSVIVFTTPHGVCVAGSSGQVVNLSQDKVSFAYDAAGSAMLREGNGLLHYVCQMNPVNPALNSFTPVALDTTAWCVNMITGGHSRYTNYPDADIDSEIAATIITPVTDLGSPTAKYVHDLYAHCRVGTDGMEFATITDEATVVDGYALTEVDIAGLTKRRVPLAHGVKAVYWQFCAYNVNNGDFALQSIDVSSVSTRRHK